ncbi:MAG: helix-turn-helix domain-containing protein [Myxococcales bacterium]
MDNAEQIRAAATHLFAQHGYDGASLQAIAERVGVTKQTLLYHYPSKDALRRAVIEGVFSHWRTRLPQMLEAVTSGHGRFEALTRELITFFENDADRALVILRELLDNPEEMRRLLGDNLRPWTLLLAQYIREGQRIDLIHEDVDPEAYVLNVIGLVLANVVSRPLVEGIMTSGGVSKNEVRERQMRELFRLTRTALFKR